MTRTMRSHELHVFAWLSASELQPHIDRSISYSRECGYSQSTVRVYRNAIAHFAHWMTANKMPLRRLNEQLIERFLSEHLPACRCGALRQRWPHTMRAALKVLLRFLRSERLLGTACPIEPPSITQELRSFAHYQGFP
jgi:site-specific recombinase XerD